MTGHLWFASPPEVHSALISAGPGTGPLLAASNACHALSIEYRIAATELQELLSAVRAGIWEGPSAELCVAAHRPYVGWLQNAANVSAVKAALMEQAATAYTSASAEIPTMGELALNHATHIALVSTNFFGINTIPIAINEADYVRMWIQAATAMSVYDGISSAAHTAAPQLPPALPILNAGPSGVNAFGNSLQRNEPTLLSLLEDILKKLVPRELADLIKELARFDLQRLLVLLVTNPAAALKALAPLITALLGFGQFFSISVMLWTLQIGSALLLFAPAIALPLAIALADTNRLIPINDPAPKSLPTNGVGPPTSRYPLEMSPGTSTATPTGPAPPTSTVTTTTSPGAPTTAGTAAPSGFLPYAVLAAGPEPPSGPNITEGSKTRTPSVVDASVCTGATRDISKDARRRKRKQQNVITASRMYVREFLDEPKAPDPVAHPVTPTSRFGASVWARTGVVDKDLTRARGLVERESPTTAERISSQPLIPGSWPDHDTER
ncbi:PPE family protein [Mycobacterium sp. NPDC050853]|uniref:PPE family protein n=1 Tax=Mycobacterium sp. NPDC050853 TaxID=3155160 RepID=UPI0033E9E081